MSKMRFNSAKLALLVVMISIVTGCNKDRNIKDHNINDRQEILFQYDYSRNATDSQHSGFLIDNKGDIITYNNPENWNHYDKFYVITKDQITENIRKCVLSEVKIPIEELHKYSGYIRNIASTKVSAKRNPANDGGTTEFICYQYSENTGIYEGHLIKMEGDYTCENLNFYSKKVATWMRDIANNIKPR